MEDTGKLIVGDDEDTHWGELMSMLKFVDTAETELVGCLAPVGGPFNGQDITHEHFSNNTNFYLEWFPEPSTRPLLFHHGLDPDVKAAVVGRIHGLEFKTDLGLWMRAQLDAHNEYYGAIKELIKQGKLGLSSGSMRHLVEVNPKSGEILRWPLIEGSLTPTPANPMAEVDFATAKSHFKAIGVEIPDEDSLKAKLTAEQEKQLEASDFAYIDSEGGRHLPIHDEAHVRNALARFNQTHFESDEAKEKAKKKIMAAARHMGIEVSENAKATTFTSSNTTLTINANWPGDVWLSDAIGFSYKLSTADMPDMGSNGHEIVQKKPSKTMHMMEMMKEMAAEMGMEMSEAEMQAMMGQMGKMDDMPEDEMKKKMRAMLAKYKTGELFALLLDEDSGLMATLAAEPLVSHAEAVKILATSLLERTKDLQERRVKEGRTISAANRKRLMQCVGDMRKACDEMQGLIDSAEPQPAKAASARLQIDLLKLYAATIN